MRFGLFGKGGPDKSEAAAQANRVKALLREIADLPEAAAIAVNEILCADPACPGTETVILVMNPGEKTKAFKLAMAMAEVTPEALREKGSRRLQPDRTELVIPDAAKRRSGIHSGASAGGVQEWIPGLLTVARDDGSDCPCDPLSTRSARSISAVRRWTARGALKRSRRCGPVCSARPWRSV